VKGKIMNRVEQVKSEKAAMAAKLETLKNDLATI
jgi:hypothetical protein